MMKSRVAGVERHPANLSPSDIGDNTWLNSLTAWQLKLYWSTHTNNFDAGDESRGHDYWKRAKAASARWADERGALSAEDLKTQFEPLS
jgi:hypothetical protein